MHSRKEVVSALIDGGTQEKAGLVLGVSQSSVYRLISLHKINKEEWPVTKRKEKVKKPGRTILAEDCFTMTISKIALKHGVTWGTVDRWLAVDGLESISVRQPRLSKEDKLLIDQLRDLPAADVADKFEISERWVLHLWAQCQ